MDKCRICLRYCKNIYSIYKYDGEITFADMIISLTNIKIIKNDAVTENICLKCCKKLRETYDFKNLIYRSDMALNQTMDLKRIHFNNINEIKVEINLIEGENKDSLELCKNFTETHFKNGETSISYNDTIIKKINNNSGNISLNMLELLKTIKTESDNDWDYGYDVDINNYASGPVDCREDNKCFQLKKKYNRKKTRIKALKHSKNSHQLSKCTNPIKPIFLEDVRVKPTTRKLFNSAVRKKINNCIRRDICPYCGKMSTNIKQHVLIHTGEKKFKCDKCTKGYFTENALRRHMKNHSDTRNFKCDKCLATFSYKAALINHFLMHSDVKSYVCNICSKAFKRKSALTRHSMIHNLSNKKIKCDQCPMSFYTNYGLRHHMRVHTGERPFKCEICSQPYSYKHDFNRHCFKKHGVFLKRRSIYIMNEDILKQERMLMRDLMLRNHGIIKDDKPLAAFEKPQAALAFEQAIKALEARQISIDYQI